MKNYYKINEISNLYNIGKDSLRYYEEIGILSPKRDVNGYRLYSIQDIEKLNIIKDLRILNFPMEKIKEYLEDRTVGNTLDILNEEITLINKKLEELKVQKNTITARMKSLREDAEYKDLEEICIVHKNDRRVIMLADTFSRDEEVDFLIKKLHRKNEDKLYVLGNNYLGVTMDKSKVMDGVFNAYTSVFFILDRDERNYDRVLPGGTYVTLSYRGSYSKSKKFMPEMLSFIHEKGWNVLDDPIELYKIDVHETSIVDEYLTELQILVERD